MRPPASLGILVLSCLPCGAAVIDVTPGANLIAIEQVIYQTSSGTVVQNGEAGGVTSTGDGVVSVQSVRITDGSPVDLTYFNTAGAKVVNVNPEFQNIAGVGVFDNGVRTTSAGGLAAYGDAFAGTTLDTDLRNYAYHDYLTPGAATLGTPDLDLLFLHALLPGEDHFLVAERWGNAAFSITALDENGNPYQEANVLRIGGTGGTATLGYEVYDWVTGYAADTDNSVQAQALSLFPVQLFFQGTQQNPAPVYGLRIDNDGEADPKIMGISADTFSNNPVNPEVIPEPSTLITVLAGALALGLRRRR